MDQRQWAALRGVIRSVCRSLGRLPRATYGDHLIACLYFWATFHNWPMTWAVWPNHYNRTFRPRKLPSVSQLNRRVASDRFQSILQRVHERLRGDSQLKGLCVDGKALPVGPCTQDRDARGGHVPGGMGKGYKLHAVVTADGNIPVFAVLPLHAHEMNVARAMLGRLGHGLTGTLVMADGNYDAHTLHKDVCRRGGWLVTRPRGRARHPVTRRQMGRSRRTLIDLWDHAPRLMAAVYHHRKHVERVFGNLTATPGLLGPLPPFVRGLSRVRRWVGAKICLYHARRLARHALEPRL
jgi:hypothetical protein